MKYQDRIVCFLDVLGFQSHIRSTLNADGSDAEEKVTDLANAFLIIRDLLDTDRPMERLDKEVTQFSDSIVISFRSDTESGVFYALLDILWVQINLVLNGILCRGGIAQGKLVHTPKLLFGPAMVEAYILESEAALYPRVILDSSIIEVGKKTHGKHHQAEHEEQSIMELLKKDSDGMYYVDYITGTQSELDDPDCDYPGYLYSLSTIVSNGLTIKSPSVSIKYKWLREKLASHIAEVKEAARLHEEDADIADAYEAIPEL